MAKTPKANSNMTTKDASAFSKNLLNLYEDKKAVFEKTKIAPMFDTLSQKHDAIATLLNGKDAPSPKLEAADAQCDAAIRRLFALSDGYTALPFEDEAAAAIRVNNTLNQFGRKIMSEKYASQSALTEALLKKLDEPAIAKDIASLHGLKECVEAVRTTSATFTALMKTQTQTSAAADKTTAYALKKEIVSYVNDTILPYLSALCLMDEKTYLPFLQEVSTEIERVNASVKASLKASKNTATIAE